MKGIITYAVQPSLDGLTQAFIIGDDTVAIVLDDNIFARHRLKK